MLKRTAHAAIAVTLAAGTLGLTSAAIAAESSGANAFDRFVRTDKGVVRGTVADSTRTFEGIPYAAPPTGNLRWAPTAPAKRWHGVRNATKPGSACPQTGLVPPAGRFSDNEDCLTVNVTTPRTAARDAHPRPRPVMVYLHGGDHTEGEGAMHGAERLAAQGDVIVVTVNYRLGALGYLAHPDLEERGERGERGESGNYGFLDQQAALRWVQRNAAAFGGDPDNVTLFGQSAGGYSTCAHLVAPSSAGLFDRVITQSAPCTADMGQRDRTKALKEGTDAAAAIEAKPEVDDWRTALPGELVYPFGQGPEYTPVYGGKLLPRTPKEAFATGRFNKVPVLQGINREEERAMVYGQELFKKRSTQNPDAQLDEADYRDALEREFGAEQAAVIADRYPITAYDNTPALALAAALTDGKWARPTVETATSLATHTRVHTYEFAPTETPWYADQDSYPKPSWSPGAGHLFELPYLFDLDAWAPLTQEQHKLSDAMIHTWSTFAHTGKTTWKPSTPTALNTQSLASGPDGIRPVDFAKTHDYDFWKSLPRP
ncbi:carboxylesterase/lipase family protein [Streptomyces apocyni]|uniref:carboxylesterase/lipase family protein n=1 Tax=Streptomyces apocyni TaxID=2654677 RepID=UPI0018D0A947|nr:carboxylesterase family protein [Streptomyces apocyni]